MKDLLIMYLIKGKKIKLTHCLKIYTTITPISNIPLAPMAQKFLNNKSNYGNKQI